ncbi:all-beta uncharacterized protein [Mangrovibacterium marinum]|uniref:All-beta uncharacterized protein n=1 Tax=Mangrovibacterium marinum TaxID=1639118 RepID=A0A2T5BZK8_9BACT|nr:M60 family metallopeptidase [Mangrovibacterium marinum]PTN07721.1 all-beta uncharacterized protein [Mangrovibacterium marinum]
MHKHRLSHLITGLILLLFMSCSKDSEVSSPTPVLEIEASKLDLGFMPQAGSSIININTNAEELQVQSTASWCNVSYDSQLKKLSISVDENAALESRTATVKVSHATESKKINVMQFGIEPSIFITRDSLITDFRSKTVTVELYSNVTVQANSNVDWIEQSPTQKSVSIDPVKYSFNFDISALSGADVREGLILFNQDEGDLVDTLLVKQLIVVSSDYIPETSESFEKDQKLTVLQASLTPADKYQSGQDISNTLDGEVSTLYHSPWGGMTPQTEITLEYTFDPETSPVMNYLVLKPRTSGANGIIKTGSVWVTTAENGNYEKVADIEAPNSNNPLVISLSSPILNPLSVKIIVTDSYTHDAGKYYVSLAEFEAYESKSVNAVAEDAAYFTDDSFSELEPGTTLEDIVQIKNQFLQNIAAYLLAGKYPAEFRIQEYEPFRPVGELAAELKTSSYSQFENPTGIYFTEGQDAILFVAGEIGNNIQLRVKNFGPSGDDHSYPLKKGLNVLTMEGQGNGYISYFNSNFENLPNVKIHIASGKVNGYFDINRHNNEDGRHLLENAVSEIMDIKGERVQLAYSVNSLKNNCLNSLYDLTIIYDSIVSNQQTLMGLRKYDRLPKNHLLGRVIWDGYMHADGWGAAFHDNTMNTIANPDILRTSIWGPAHEFGHVNQTRPGLVWVGTTEVTNNLFSSWIQYNYTPGSMRLEHENVGGAIGGRFNNYFYDAFINRYEWGLQSGPNATYGPNSDGAWGGDVFVSLVPLWQLQLFFHVAGEGNDWHRPFFYGDVFEAVRNTDETSLTQGELQLNFVKNVCDAVQFDLTDFFTNIGMLKEVDKLFGDYSSRQKTITTAMIEETINYISKYPKPACAQTIQYISVNNLNAYQNQLPVQGSYGQGINELSDAIRINHSVWKNVVVFETYSGNELSRLTMTGSGDASNSSTTVPFPDGASRIEAVAFDGTRTLVYGQ